MPQMCHLQMGYDAAIRARLAHDPEKWNRFSDKIMRK
jgi:hypothetical protein